MRVLHFFKTAMPDTMGGIEQVIDQIARGSTQHGIDVDVLALTPNVVPRTVEVNGYRLHRARLDLQVASTGFSASVFIRFAQLAREADVIHYHFPWPFMDLMHFATQLKKPSIVTYHSDIIRQKRLLKLYRPLKNKFLASVDRIVATSPNYLATSNVLKKFSNKVSVIPIGLDKNAYPSPTLDRLDYWRQKLGPRFFLFIGVLRYYKGLHILVDAAQGIDYPIAIVGAGPIENELKAQAISLGLSNIKFLGKLSDEDKTALLTQCYGVVFPSHLRSEAFGISLLEGAMFGKPMISSEIGTGTTYINIAEETGLVVEPGDVEGLREAMRRLWDNYTEAAKMGQRAEARFQQFFRADQMVSAYTALYHELVNK